jgi:cell division protein FtsB
MKSESASRGPRPMTAFIVSLAISSVLMGVLLLSDRRVLELRRARAEVEALDRQIAERRRENEGLRTAIDAANKHEFPAEKAAREELHLTASDDVVLLYPPGTLTAPGTAAPGAAAGGSPAAAPTPAPRPR